ncbi:tRNA isopentenyltransferase [Auricularia subglabra TFB-10046 SS5]|nr:tRNA isopentenyltransferase [Auricularia subglabra TFB-10046 SS5]
MPQKGVGKSKLAVEIGLALSRKLVQAAESWTAAEVINADSMQVYRGLDVITNKIPEEETQGVQHHLIGFKDIGEQYVVHEWIHDALPLIDRAHREKRLPLVVGGTAYWIQHLVFPDRLAATEDGPSTRTPSAALQAAMATMTPDQLELFDLLTHLDPTTAARWHWRDTRKVLRSLQLANENGCLASELFAAQSERELLPRYRTLLFWLNAAPEALNPRLDQRIETMVELGLLDEIRTMRAIADKLDQPVDYTQGIFQAIGYKEFSDYLDDPAHPPALYEDAMERMRVSTRKYAQRQIKWIRNKLLPAVHAAGPSAASIVVLDASSLDGWDREVRDRALACLDSMFSRIVTCAPR